MRTFSVHIANKSGPRACCITGVLIVFVLRVVLHWLVQLVTGRNAATLPSLRIECDQLSNSSDNLTAIFIPEDAWNSA